MAAEETEIHHPVCKNYTPIVSRRGSVNGGKTVIDDRRVEVLDLYGDYPPVISCPCALSVECPLAFFSGIGAGSKTILQGRTRPTKR